MVDARRASVKVPVTTGGADPGKGRLVSFLRIVPLLAWALTVWLIHEDNRRPGPHVDVHYPPVPVVADASGSGVLSGLHSGVAGGNVGRVPMHVTTVGRSSNGGVRGGAPVPGDDGQRPPTTTTTQVLQDCNEVRVGHPVRQSACAVIPEL